MPFTPIQTSLGGFLLHLSTSNLLTDTGRVLGISGVVDGAIHGDGESWRWSIILGLLFGPALLSITGLDELMPDSGTGAWATQSVGRLALAGMLVGLGTKVTYVLSGERTMGVSWLTVGHSLVADAPGEVTLVPSALQKIFVDASSGHFLCGVSRLSPRSLVATATFFTTALLTANIFPGPIEVPTPAYSLEIPSTTAIAILSSAIFTLYLANSLRRRVLPSSSQPSTPIRLAPYFLQGVTFSLGLVMSGMVSPSKVISFLRISPTLSTFDPSLAMIVLTGVLPNAIHYAHLKRDGRVKPRYPWESWRLPTRTDIDWRLAFGSALFGVGWGMSGVCPGPAIVGAGQIGVDWARGVGVGAVARGWAAFALSAVVGMRVAGLTG